MNNPNCDGSGPCHSGQVRVLPTGGDSNAILCRYCFNREIAFRVDRNRELSKDCQFKLPTWDSLKIYGEPEPQANSRHEQPQSKRRLNYVEMQPS